MRISRFMGAGALALGLAALMACDRRDDAGGRTSDRTGTRTGTDRAAEPRDNSWLVEAGESNLAEVEAGRLAEQKASSPDVRQFARQMVEDHTQANTELSEVATKKGMTVPTQPSEDARKKLADLAELNGAEFDRKYGELMVEEHEKAVSLFESNQNARDADVKAFAEKTLPTLRHHLQMARDLKSKVSGAPKAD